MSLAVTGIHNFVIKPLEICEMVREHYVKVKCRVNIPLGLFYLFRVICIVSYILNNSLWINMPYVLDFGS